MIIDVSTGPEHEPGAGHQQGPGAGAVCHQGPQAGRPGLPLQWTSPGSGQFINILFLSHSLGQSPSQHPSHIQS